MLQIVPTGTVDIKLVYNPDGLPFRIIQRYTGAELLVGMGKTPLRDMFTDDELLEVVRGKELYRTVKYEDLCKFFFQNVKGIEV